MKKLFFACFIFLSAAANGQHAAAEEPEPRNAFTIGYYGQGFSNPGIQLGMERILARTGKFEILSLWHLHYFNQKDRLSGIGFLPRFGQRFTLSSGFFLENYIGLGLQLNRFRAEVFDHSHSPSTVKIETTNKAGILPVVTLGTGYDFSRKTNLQMAFYLRTSANWLYPDQNLLFRFYPSLETGIIYRRSR